jgi:hypothetical protein
MLMQQGHQQLQQQMYQADKQARAAEGSSRTALDW